MKYYLSNAQRKELLVRAVPLAIALPAPMDDPDDWLIWAQEALGDDGQYVHRTPEVFTLPVGPVKSDAGLTSIIGGFVRPTGEFYWRVEVAVVELDPPCKPRGVRGKIQWPAFVRDNFGRWPREVSDAKK